MNTLLRQLCWFAPAHQMAFDLVPTYGEKCELASGISEGPLSPRGGP